MRRRSGLVYPYDLLFIYLYPTWKIPNYPLYFI